MKFNPFKPNGIISPGIFTGRLDEMRAIEHGLFQAKHGNPIHFMIQGERGIGKSSLFFVTKLVANGEIETFTNEKLNFLVISVDLGAASNQMDIIRTIGRELKDTIGAKSAVKERARAFWDWATNWEILGVRYHKDGDSFDPHEALDAFVSQVASLCGTLSGEIDGILILIDEADRPGADAKLGEFCKLMTERLARKECNNVVLGLAGLPTLLGRLKESHESSPRLFTTMLLDPLLPAERIEVIDRGMKVANEKNTAATSITLEATNLLADLSEGYPHFIQQFAFSAFQYDKDNLITAEDVIGGAFSENGALSQLGDKYFNEMYHLRIASNDYRHVLNTMAAHGDQWVSRRQIIEESALAKTTVTNALNALKARQIIMSDDSRKGRGFYRLPTRSFAAWINAIRSVSERTEGQVGFAAGVPLDTTF
ncbi:ATP-binding protein [Mesorhizobium sp. INR15]|uniref:ATP-binding protein n=1 Tax=Mesorhizobium sp. INR15 TaxID=2654248 RepID=UPI0018968DD4|nr:ATP-binding protein [Mesorhizobium sp. INR15]QPC90020.1 hypothetical protein GA829_05125 [Mesorhizobium sp. INR15]